MGSICPECRQLEQPATFCALRHLPRLKKSGIEYRHFGGTPFWQGLHFSRCRGLDPDWVGFNVFLAAHIGAIFFKDLDFLAPDF